MGRIKRKSKTTLEKKKKRAIFKNKIKHYKKTQNEQYIGVREVEREIIPTAVPHRLREYSPLSIFGPPESLPSPEKPLGPFICDRNIKISPEELLVLQKDPKFSIRKMASNSEFQVELEKSLSKHRYRVGDHSQKKKERKNRQQTGLELWAQGTEREKGRFEQNFLNP